MTGSAAERKLLGAVIIEPNQYRFTEGLVTGADFADARMGDVFAGIGSMIARNEPVDHVTVEQKFPQWGVRGFGAGVTWDWGSADVLPFAVHEYARAVRDDSVRRALKAAVQNIFDQVQHDAPMDVATTALQSMKAIVDGAASGSLGTKTLAEVLDGSDEYDWVIPDLLERQDRLVFTGAEGAGKTTFCRQLAVLAAAGIHPTTFQPIDPVKVLVVDAENTEKQWRRAVRWTSTNAAREGSADPRQTINIMAGKRIDITKGPHLSEIHRLIDRHEPDVLFIGPLYKLVPGAINNDDDAAPLIVALDSLRDRGVTLVMEAHAGKGVGADGERALAPRGSAALLGWPEFGMGLRPTENPNVVQVVRWRGDRDSREGFPKYMQRGMDWPWEHAVEADAYDQILGR